MTATPRPQPTEPPLDYYQARILIGVFKDCQRSPGAYAHLRDLLQWNYYQPLVELGYIEGVNFKGWDIYRITVAGCEALAEYAASPPTADSGR